MKQKLFPMALVTLAILFTFQGISQELLPEVIVKAIRYKYLSAVNQNVESQPVKMLERRAAEFDIKKADFYEEEYDNYFVSFYIPEGQILASYDKDGKLLSTAEKFKDINLPQNVRKSIVDRFPEWMISSDIYLVNYHEKNNKVDKVYKVTLSNGDKRLKVKLNDKGEFL